MNQLHHSLEIDVNGEAIAAALHLPRRGTPAPVAVCAHGLSGTRVGSCYRFVTLARRLTDLGLACLRFDFRGCGESSGTFQDVTPQRLVEDLHAVIGGLGTLQGCDESRIAIVASSYGAFTTALSVDVLGAVGAYVFWAPVADPQKLVDRDMTPPAREFLAKHGWVEHFGLKMGRGFVEGIPPADAPALLASLPRPLLVIHGKGDRHVPIEHGRGYVDAMRANEGNTRLLELDIEDHGMRSVAANEQITAETADWCRRFLSA